MPFYDKWGSFKKTEHVLGKHTALNCKPIPHNTDVMRSSNLSTQWSLTWISSHLHHWNYLKKLLIVRIFYLFTSMVPSPFRSTSTIQKNVSLTVILFKYCNWKTVEIRRALLKFVYKWGYVVPWLVISWWLRG